MTEPRKSMFAHIGGPYDGTRMQVEVDSEGTPAETNTIYDITTPNMLFNPARTSQVDRLIALYERVEVLGHDGFGYEFRYVVQNVTNLSDRKAA